MAFFFSSRTQREPSVAADGDLQPAQVDGIPHERHGDSRLGGLRSLIHENTVKGDRDITIRTNTGAA
jgi:hypothetical protein